MKTSASYTISEVYDGDKLFTKWGTSSSKTSAPTSFTNIEPSPASNIFIWRKEGHGLTEDSATWGNPICMTGSTGAKGDIGAKGSTGSKGDTGDKGDDGDFGILTLSFTGSTISLQGNGETDGYIIYNNTKFYMSGSYSCRVGGDGIIIADISQSTVIPSFKKMILDENNKISFVDFNTGYTPITKDMVDNNWQYIMIGEFSCLSSGIIINAMLKPSVSAATFLSDSFTSILKNAVTNGADIDAWSRAMGCSQYFNSLAVSKLFAGQLFTQSIILSENGSIESSNYTEGSDKGFKLNADGSLVANSVDVKGGTFKSVDVTGKFTSDSLETFDKAPDIDTSWNLSQDIEPLSITEPEIQPTTLIKDSTGKLKTIFQIIYGNNVYVALLEESLSISTDGVNWGQAFIPIGFHYVEWDTMYFLNNKFIGVGDFGNIYTSTNGVDWVELDRIVPGDVNTDDIQSDQPSGLIYFKGKYILYFNLNRRYTSTDLIHWTYHEVFFTERTSYVATDGNIVVRTNGSEISYSTDGLTWSEYKLLDFGIVNLLYINNKFIALTLYGSLYYSTDGLTWSDKIIITQEGSIWGLIAYCNGIWFSTGGSRRYSYSRDLVNWRPPESLLDQDGNNLETLTIFSTGSFFILGGSNGKITYTTNKPVYSIAPIIDYLSNLLNSLSVPSGQTLNAEPLEFATFVTGTIKIGSTSYPLSKLKVSSSNITFISNGETYSFNKSNFFDETFKVIDLKIIGAAESNAITGLLPKNGNGQGFIGKDGKAFLSSYIVNMTGSKLDVSVINSTDINATSIDTDSITLPNGVKNNSNGYYIIMPNGLIVQWGSRTVSENARNTYSFPIDFTHKPSVSTGSDWYNAKGWAPSGGWAISTSQYRLWNVENSLTVFWLAIGY